MNICGNSIRFTKDRSRNLARLLTSSVNGRRFTTVSSVRSVAYEKLRDVASDGDILISQRFNALNLVVHKHSLLHST